MDLKALFTTDEEMEELEDRDMTTNITGYVVATSAPVVAGKKSTKLLFKFVMSNGNKKIDVLIWGQTLINKYYKDISSSRVINVNGAHCRAVAQSKYKEKNQFVPFEILIRENTSVSFLGYYGLGEEIKKLQTVTFDNINSVEGLIEIAGFIRTPFSLIHNRSGEMSYGLGAITDGVKKITIQVKQFVASKLQVGDAIVVKGTVDGQDSLVTIVWNNMDDIKLDSEVSPLSAEKIMHGGRPVKRIRSKK